MKKGQPAAERNFFRRVYQTVARIPEGKVATFGLIAALIGEPWNARVVGWAMHKAPKRLRLPCHRVVNKAGNMGPGYLFGPGEQRKLLEDEGVAFTADGCVDMEKHLWDPYVHIWVWAPEGPDRESEG